MMNEYTPKQRMTVVVSTIKYQIGQSPEEKLMFAIFERAAIDAFGIEWRDSARDYLLNSDLPHLQYLGIDKEWVIDLFKKHRLIDALKK